ncbi:hypothetical protein A471_06776 [Ectopseudomonas mendocina DLHK]|jgi:uncharacterized membrane protein YgcG|nr:hypothetical protein CO724_00560 [Pseudomonas mendocina]EJO94780.1 hypothetical protein A471_06776 [Pseudomonas mendocina DLHK]
MDILLLFAVAFAVLLIYWWRRSRPRRLAHKRERSGLNGQDSGSGFSDGGFDYSGGGDGGGGD